MQFNGEKIIILTKCARISEHPLKKSPQYFTHKTKIQSKEILGKKCKQT